MTELALITRVSDVLVNGMETTDELERSMVLRSFNHVNDNNNAILSEIYNKEWGLTNNIPHFSDFVYSIDEHNEEMIRKMSIIDTLEYYHDNEISTNDVNIDEFDEMVEVRSNEIVDYYSYNGYFDSGRDAVQFLYDSGATAIINYNDDAYDDIVEYRLRDDEYKDIIINSAQQLMFSDLLGKPKHDSLVCKYGEFFLLKESVDYERKYTN